MVIEVIAVAYDGYAKYIKQFLRFIELQSVQPNKITIVCGRKHGLNQDIPGINIIHDNKEPAIGRLLNIALDQSTADYVLAPDIDDVILPNAIEEIKKVKADVILCDYFARKGTETKILQTFNPLEQKNYYGKPGYYAFRRLARYQDHDYRDIPMLLSLATAGATFGKTKVPVFFYTQNKEGHAVKYADKRPLAAKLLKEAYKQHEAENHPRGVDRT